MSREASGRLGPCDGSEGGDQEARLHDDVCWHPPHNKPDHPTATHDQIQRSMIRRRTPLFWDHAHGPQQYHQRPVQRRCAANDSTYEVWPGVSDAGSGLTNSRIVQCSLSVQMPVCRHERLQWFEGQPCPATSPTSCSNVRPRQRHGRWGVAGACGAPPGPHLRRQRGRGRYSHPGGHPRGTACSSGRRPAARPSAVERAPRQKGQQ